MNPVVIHMAAALVSFAEMNKTEKRNALGPNGILIRTAPRYSPIVSHKHTSHHYAV
jgi:hypothetical protein